MAVKSFVILVTITLQVEARLNINVTVGSFRKDVKVQTSGSDLKLITEKEVSMFNVTDLNLNRGFRVELGKEPDNLFLKDPTLHNNLFQHFKWEPVKRKMFIKKVKILETVSEDEGVVLKRQRFINNSTAPVRSKVRIFEDVENAIYSSWSKQGVSEENINYDLIINLNNNHFKYTNKWRDDRLRSRNLPFGLSREGYVEIKPGQTVTTKLFAKKTIVLVEITYAAVLTGSIIGDYRDLYGKYHFYAPSVMAIMKAANLKNEILTTELVEIRCYTSPDIEIVDGQGRKVYIVRPLTLVP